MALQKSQAGGAIWCVPRWASKAHNTKSLWQWLWVHMGGTICTLHYILSKGAMKCVWGIVSVHVSVHGISDYQCYYKASTNEFCQRQLWTWWNGQSKHEKLALCGLGILHRDPCFFLYPVFDPRCLCPKESGPPFHHWCSARGGIICSSTFALFISVPNWIPVCQAQAWSKVILVLLSPRDLFHMF